MALSDSDGIVLRANLASCALNGLVPESFIGRGVAVIFPVEACAAAGAALDGCFGGELRALAADGSERWSLTSGQIAFAVAGAEGAIGANFPRRGVRHPGHVARRPSGDSR